MSKLYRQTELTEEEMDNYAFPHLLAMTGESLHSKAEIAEELGVRDRDIQLLKNQLKEILTMVEMQDDFNDLGDGYVIERCHQALDEVKL